jgi:hypothetical protein
MQLIRRTAIAFAAILAIGLASVGSAQENKDITYDGTAGGKITAVSGSSISIQGYDNDSGTFAINDKTQVMNQEKTIAATDLKVGWSVAISWDYTAPNSKDKVAQLIEVEDAP